MNKEFYDKHSKDLGCHICSNLQQCINCDEPLWINCSRIFYKERTADLEAKLAESKEFLIATKWKVEDLEQQLAEKEKEIETLKEENERNKAEAESQHKSFIDCFKDKMGLTLYYDNTEKQHNQDKIDYAVEQLEKVKGKLSEDINNVKPLLDPTEYEDYNQLIGVIRGYRNSIYEIQKVITEIKEGK